MDKNIMYPKLMQCCSIPVAFSLLLASAIGKASAAGPTYQVIHSFSGLDGSQPTGDLVFGQSGILYGTTNSYGPNYGLTGSGTVFSLSLANNSLTTQWQFTGNADGAEPYAGLAYSRDILYGTTLDSATVFKLPVSGALSTQSVLSGYMLYAPVVVGPSGNVYGAAVGSTNQGALFAVNRKTGKLSILHAFSGGADGGQPYGGMVTDTNGNLYGTTSFGPGAGSGCGTVFKLTPATKAFVTLYTFGTTPGDGCHPTATMTLDTLGNLYGTTKTTSIGSGFGTIFEINTATLAFSTRYTFPSDGSAGVYPFSRVVFGPKNALYGTTSGGVTAVGNYYGTIFSFNPTSGVFVTLYSFSGGADGATPIAGLVYDKKKSLYGTTENGGITNGFGENGVVFKVTP